VSTTKQQQLAESLKRHHTGVNNVIVVVKTAVNLEARHASKPPADFAISTRVLRHKSPAQAIVNSKTPVDVVICTRVLRHRSPANAIVKSKTPVHVAISTRVLRHKTHAQATVSTEFELVPFDVDQWIWKRELYLDRMDAIWGVTRAIVVLEVSTGGLFGCAFLCTRAYFFLTLLFLPALAIFIRYTRAS